jgi:hypothetical protein
MIFSRRIFTAIILGVFTFNFACGGGSDNAAAPAANTAVVSAANSAGTNAEELGVLIRMPYETEDVVWKQDASGKRVIAVLRFSPSDAEKIVAESGGQGSGVGSIPVESWFPEDLTAQAEMNGDNALKGVSYPPTAFVQEPYSSGKITRVAGTDYFIVEMTRN